MGFIQNFGKKVRFVQASFENIAFGSDHFALSAQMKLLTGVMSTEKTAVAFPANDNVSILTVAGGQVMLLALIGEITTIVETATTNVKIQFAGTASAGTSDLCAVLNLTATAVGTLLGINGLSTVALVKGSAPRLTTPLVLNAGAIKLHSAAASTGASKWKALYIPVDTGATIAAA